jgi:Domain of unknown function (DUF4193)
VSTSVDYDVRRQNRTQDSDDDCVQVIKAVRGDIHSEVIDADDEDDTAPQDEVVGQFVADLLSRSGQEPTVRVVPMQAGEFTCGRCFLIYSRNRLARSECGQHVCRDCG